jgi:hypothetical protein
MSGVDNGDGDFEGGGDFGEVSRTQAVVGSVGTSRASAPHRRRTTHQAGAPARR